MIAYHPACSIKPVQSKPAPAIARPVVPVLKKATGIKYIRFIFALYICTGLKLGYNLNLIMN